MAAHRLVRTLGERPVHEGARVRAAQGAERDGPAAAVDRERGVQERLDVEPAGDDVAACERRVERPGSELTLEPVDRLRGEERHRRELVLGAEVAVAHQPLVGAHLHLVGRLLAVVRLGAVGRSAVVPAHRRHHQGDDLDVHAPSVAVRLIPRVAHFGCSETACRADLRQSKPALRHSLWTANPSTTEELVLHRHPLRRHVLAWNRSPTAIPKVEDSVAACCEAPTGSTQSMACQSRQRSRTTLMRAVAPLTSCWRTARFSPI